MRIGACIASLPVVFAASAFAADEADLSTRSRALAAKSFDAAQAPFAQRPEAAIAPLFSTVPPAHVDDAGGCAPQSTQALCYEGVRGQLVYRGAREYMPRLEGLTPESVALRRGKLILRYSFR
ncbi:MAG TPA: hypothetical protein VFJ62_19685 [Usitatibacter sp.]|nr:hypothetical protein [Usitatibacter sp.]